MTPSELHVTLEHLLSEPVDQAREREQTAFDRLSVPHGESVILFGTGKLGRKTLSGLRKAGIRPLAFCDNNRNLWGKNIDGLQVLSPEEAVASIGEKASFVVCIWSDVLGHPIAEVRKQLTSLGKVNVISFVTLYWKYHQTFLPYFCLDLPHKVLPHRREILEAGSLLSDGESRKGFLGNILFRLGINLESLPPPAPTGKYFNFDFFRKNSSEIFVDAGAFTGDTIQAFLSDRGHDFGQIIALEPDPDNYSKLIDYIESLDDLSKEKIYSHQVALTRKEGTVHFEASGTDQSQIAETGGISVQGFRLDELLADRSPTLIKMDIEGAEPEAIEGCSGIIAKNPPLFAVSAYHVFDHIWIIPLLLKRLYGDYRFFLRAHAAGGWDYILYAVPPSRFP